MMSARTSDEKVDKYETEKNARKNETEKRRRGGDERGALGGAIDVAWPGIYMSMGAPERRRSLRMRMMG